MKTFLTITLGVLICATSHLTAGAKKKNDELNSLDRFVRDAREHQQNQLPASAGGIWSPAARFGDLGTDLRANKLDDIVTILVEEKASAVSSGATKSARSSSAKAGVNAIGIIPRVNSPLPNLARMSSESNLAGEGTTSRETSLKAALTARVIGVLPNGFLIIEGTKRTTINSEMQTVKVRGIARPVDLGPGNTIPSDRLAEMEVELNGKGVVGDAIRRPFILYRILLGLLPF